MSNRFEIYTPSNVVSNMLDEISYFGNNIIKKHIIDNSCGEGAFLIQIVERYLDIVLENKMNFREIKTDLETFVHGIDINQESVNKTVKSLNKIVNKRISHLKIKWDIVVGNTLEIYKFNNKMDFVVGNPPYVNIHNMNHIDYKSFNFTNRGMADLYLIFFEIGIKMLNITGKLIYITPNSFLTSKAGYNFRKYIIKEKLLHKIIDNKHTPIFDKAQTYTVFTLLSKDNNENCIYFDTEAKMTHIIKYNDFYINDCFYFKAKYNNEVLKILNTKLNSDILIRNGIATNANNVFFGYTDSKKFVKKAFKIRNLGDEDTKYNFGIFPYDNNGKIFTLTEIKNKDKNLFNYLQRNKKILMKRKLDSNQKWWGYSRTQGLNLIDKEKLVINNILRSEEQVKLKIIPKNTLIYGSGYYLYSKNSKYSLNFLKKLIKENATLFIDYLQILGKNKGSSYYFFNTEDLNKFLNFLIIKQENLIVALENDHNSNEDIEYNLISS